MAKRKKKYNPVDKAREKVVGLVVSWSDESPMMDATGFIPGEITHKNPVNALYIAAVYSKLKNWIVNEQEFFWRVTMNLVFDYPNGSRQYEGRELVALIRLTDLDKATEEQFHDAMRHGDKDKYSHTEFKVECLGKNYQSTSEEG